MNALRFEGTGFEYFKIWIVNVLLTIITFGLYYPWAKVRNRRYFYGNTTLDGHNFEYHATGRQLFVSHLIAMALLFTYVFISSVSEVGAGLFFVVLFIGFPWVIWRGLIFNMRVTSFSNVRFNFAGTLGGSYFNYMLLPFLGFVAVYLPIFIAAIAGGLGTGGGEPGGSFAIALTLGFLSVPVIGIFVYAWIRKHNQRYVVNGSSYGQGVFQANLEAARFVSIYAKAAGLYLLISIAVGLVGFLVFGGLASSESWVELGGMLEDGEASGGEINPAAAGGIFLTYLAILAIGLAVMAYTTARVRAYVYANTTLDGDIQFASTLRARSLFGVWSTNALLIVLTLGLALPWTKVRAARLHINNTHVDTSSGLDEYVTQKQDEQSSLGDQIGDAFDVGVDVAI